MTQVTSSADHPEVRDAGPTDRSGLRQAWPVWVLLAVVLTASGLAPNKIAGSWHFVVTGVQAVFQSGGDWSHVYADHPDVQMGPLTFLVGAPFVLAGPGHGKSVATLLMTALGFVLLAWIVWLARRCDGRDLPGVAAVRAGAGRVSDAAAGLRPLSRLTILAAGLMFLLVWAEVSTRAGHLDDILALSLTLAALATRLRHQTLATALLLGLAADSKPWAIAFVPLLLDLSAGVRRNAEAIGVWVLVLAVGFGPFAVFDPATVHASKFTIPTEASSGLRALGFGGSQTPGWDRPAQALIGAALGVVAIALRRPASVPLLGMAVRIALDPGVHPYYNSGLLLTTVIVDLLLLRRRIPWLTFAAFALIEVANYGMVSPDFVGARGPALAGVLRLLTCTVLCAVALLARPPRTTLPRTTLPRTTLPGTTVTHL